MAPRRKVFVSYHHHGDGAYYERFIDLFATTYDVVQDHSVERQIESADADYVMRRIREAYLTGASVTIVLCGRNTYGRKYVDWEILASLNQQMGLVGFNLPTNPPESPNSYLVPGRFSDNIQTGYAVFRYWNEIITNPASLSTILEESLAKSKGLIDNSRARRLHNAPLR